MSPNFDSLIALLVASAAIFSMIILLYRKKAVSLKGAIMAGCSLVAIVLFLAMTL